MEISKERDLITISIPVRWKGGFTGGEYVTTVGWIIGRDSHIKAMCWRSLKTDHLCSLKIDQGGKPRGSPLGAG